MLSRILGLCLVAAGSICGADYSVNCPSDTLASALAAAKLSPPPNRIVISGVCTENNKVEGHRELVIEGLPGAELKAASPDSPVLSIRNGDRITIQKLALNAGAGRPDLLRVQFSAPVFVEGCTFSGGMSALLAADNSIVEAANTMISSARTGAYARDGGRLKLTGNLEIADCSYAAIRASAGSVALNGPATLHGSQYGIELSTGSAVWINGPISIENAAVAGVQSGGDFIITAPGVSIRHNSTGLRLLNGVSQLYQTVVENNTEAGVELDRHATAAIFNSTIQNNRGAGIVVSHGSVLSLLDSAASGNGQWDLVCNTESHAYGERAGVAKLACPGFAASSGPKPKPIVAEE